MKNVFTFLPHFFKKERDKERTVSQRRSLSCGLRRVNESDAAAEGVEKSE